MLKFIECTHFKQRGHSDLTLNYGIRGALISSNNGIIHEQIWIWYVLTPRWQQTQWWCFLQRSGASLLQVSINRWFTSTAASSGPQTDGCYRLSRLAVTHFPAERFQASDELKILSRMRLSSLRLRCSYVILFYLLTLNLAYFLPSALLAHFYTRSRKPPGSCSSSVWPAHWLTGSSWMMSSPADDTVLHQRGFKTTSLIV